MLSLTTQAACISLSFILSIMGVLLVLFTAVIESNVAEALNEPGAGN